MKIKLDYHSSEPLYWQAVLEIKRLVVTKRLKPGDKLPSVRVLAEQLQLNATTIRRIFDQLAKEGIVIQRHGSGVFITDAELPFSPEYVQKVMTRQAVIYLIEGLRLGLDFNELQKILERQYKNLMQEDCSVIPATAGN
ncbi:MAG: GntR family transcriptional regulator [Planctomycetaceae bacterium]|nr:GntR family transcriptional regulator [Planctomycetaceae bacterium]